MRKICLAAIMALAVPSMSWAEEGAGVTTFEYKRPPVAESGPAAEPENSSAAEPKQLQRSRSRPKVVTYGAQDSASTENAAPSRENNQKTKLRQSKTETTTFGYKRPPVAESGQAAEPENLSAAEPKQRQQSRSRPKAATYDAQESAPTENAAPDQENDKKLEHGQGRANITTFQYRTTAETAAEEPSEVEPDLAAQSLTKQGLADNASAVQPKPEDQAVVPPKKPEGEYTTIKQKDEAMEMVKPASARPKSRKTKAAAKQKAVLATPTFDGTNFNVAGIYVKCPKNKEENCEDASSDFRAMFPKDQTAPYVMLRQDGRGYVAPDSKRTVDLTWQFLGDNAILIIMDDAKHRKVEYRTVGRYLHDISTGNLFYMSLTDEEWNVPPEPYSKVKARKDKQKP